MSHKFQMMNMGNKTPQLENGFTRIANELIDKLASFRISGEEWQVLWVIIRKTYGFQKKIDKISLSQFTRLTNLKRQNVFRAIKKLSSKKIIAVIKNDDSQINSYCFNKLYTQWKAVIKKDYSKKTVIKKDDRVSSKRMIELSSKVIPTKESTKETITKDNINSIIPFFKNVNPSYEQLFKNKTQRLCLDRLIKKYGEDRLKNLLNQLPSIIQRPYAPRITTPYELEAKMGQLIVFMKQEQIKIDKGGVTKV